MEQLKEIYKTYEKANIPVRRSKLDAFLKMFVWIILGLIVVGSIIFRENILDEMSLVSKLILVSLFIKVFLLGPKTIPTPSEIELRFYKDYLIVYRPKRYYTDKLTRREYNKFLYSEILKLEFNSKTKRFDINGNIDVTFYKYDKNDVLSKEPYHQKYVDDCICNFYVINNDADNIIEYMEKYTEKKVNIIK